MKKILAFTSIRSEYDLLSYLYKLLHQDEEIDFKLLVSGAHLSETFGYTVKDIVSDGFPILAQIETLIDGSSKSSRIKSASLLLQNSIDIIRGFNPDIMIFAGDREDVVMASLIGGYLEIPTIHFFGGDHAKDSHIDSPIRHATSKLSSAHFVSTNEHYQRLLKMGEDSKRIFTIGNVALDKFYFEPIIQLNEIKEYFNIVEGFDKFAIVIFHPLPQEMNNTGQIFENILKVLEDLNINSFVSYPNVDPGNYQIIDIINKYGKNNNFRFYKNLPRNIFINLYRNAIFIIGNSSSGISESATLKIPAINVGLRQVGRSTNQNVIFTNTSREQINKSINIALSESFQNMVKDVKNLQGDGKSSQRAYELIKTVDFIALLSKNEDILEME